MPRYTGPGPCPTGACGSVSERNEAYGFESIRTSRGLVAEEPRGWGWCEAISERSVFLAKAAMSRWDCDIEWGRRPIFQAEDRPCAGAQQ